MKSRSIYKQHVKLRESDALKVTCAKCGSEIHADDININASLAKCSRCNTVFSVQEDQFFTEERVGRPEMIMPEGTDVLELSDSLDIRLDWLKSHPRGTLGFLTFFAVVWNGIMGVAVAGFISAGLENLAFLSVHILVGLGLMYYLATVYLNYTDIVVTSDRIEISHRPIKNPFIRRKSLRVQEIDQLYVNKYVSSTTNGKPNYAYALYAIMKMHPKKVMLIKGMNRETQLYLEQEIERFLKIKDRPVEDAIVS